MRSALLLPWLLIIGSCSSPPKPPTVDETNRRPVNTAQAVELQACKNELQNMRISAAESARLAHTAIALQERQQVLLSAASQRQGAKDASANEVFTVHFPFGRAEPAIPPDLAQALASSARAAPLVLLRGRTDGNFDSATESRIARRRMEAVRDHLIAAGVGASRIRATHQPSGDHIADNSTSTGRSLNRRVEIEVYRHLPVAFNPERSNHISLQEPQP